MKEILKIIDLKERENYIYKHGVYYIGEFKNNERNGKGKEYITLTVNYYLEEILLMVYMKEKVNILIKMINFLWQEILKMTLS